ncbi:hypothetical protein IKG20_00370 [Candidatus Saccharibacteria bacterium]|nr:hypothetical protein [Candidatus Saccharibacteria bacterium]
MEGKDDDIILPETEAIDYSDAPVPPKPHEKKTLAIAISAAIVLLVLCGALIFVVIQKNHSAPENSEDDTSTAEDSSPLYNIDADEFNDTMNLVDNFINLNDHYEAENYLRSFSAVERMTAVQRYRYYSAFAKLYSKEHKNDPELEKTYSMKAEQALNEIREGGK